MPNWRLWKMTLDDFIELCNKNNLPVEQYSENWYIANIKSKFIKASWIITHCTADDKTLLTNYILTDGDSITYNGHVVYNEADFNRKLEIVRDLIKLCKKKEIENKLEVLKNDF